MLTDEEYITQAIESILFFTRSATVFALNIKFSFLVKDVQYIEIADDFRVRFSQILEETKSIANKNISESSLKAGIFVSDYTLPMELLTEELFGIIISKGITINAFYLTPGIPNPTPELLQKIDKITNSYNIVLDNFISFLEKLLEEVTNSRIFVFNYAMTIQYALNKAKLSKKSMERIITKSTYNPTYITIFQAGLNNLIAESSVLLAAFINQSEYGEILILKNYSIEFALLFNQYSKPLTPTLQQELSTQSYNLIISYIEFLKKILEKIKNKDLQIAVEPIFIDAFLTEANFYKYAIEGHIEKF